MINRYRLVHSEQTYRWRNDYGREVGVPNGTMQVSGTSSIQTNSTTYTPINQMLVSPGVDGEHLYQGDLPASASSYRVCAEDRAGNRSCSGPFLPR